MGDVHLAWAGDFGSSATGDLAVVERPALGTERVPRRLLTNPGAYIWHPEYGGGLGRYVGQPVDVAGVEAVIRSQMAREGAVAREPEPVVLVRSDPGGSLFVQIRYADAGTGQVRSLNIELPG